MSDILESYRNTIVCMDVLDFLHSLPDASVPLFIFSPPYNMGNSSGGGLHGGKSKPHYADTSPMNKRGGSGKWKKAIDGGLAHGYDTFSDSMPHHSYVDWQHAIIRECWRCIPSDGAIYYNHKPRIFNGSLLLPTSYIPNDLHVWIRQVVIWARAGGINFSPSFYVPTHEWIVILAKPDFRLKSKGASGVGDVWYIPQVSNTWHPAPFPPTLVDRVLETVAPSLVVDPFCGSGTVPIQAKRAGIDYIGSDLSSKYTDHVRSLLSDIHYTPRFWDESPHHEQSSLGITAI